MRLDQSRISQKYLIDYKQWNIAAEKIEKNLGLFKKILANWAVESYILNKLKVKWSFSTNRQGKKVAVSTRKMTCCHYVIYKPNYLSPFLDTWQARSKEKNKFMFLFW